MVSTSKCECCSWYLCGPSTDCSRSNFFSLTDEDDDVHYYVLMGTEGGNLTWHPRAQWGLWNEGEVTRRENGSAAVRTPMYELHVRHTLTSYTNN
jgi:hypothetical protein